MAGPLVSLEQGLRGANQNWGVHNPDDFRPYPHCPLCQWLFLKCPLSHTVKCALNVILHPQLHWHGHNKPASATKYDVIDLLLRDGRVAQDIRQAVIMSFYKIIGIIKIKRKKVILDSWFI